MVMMIYPSIVPFIQGYQSSLQALSLKAGVLLK